jgi:CheY-like chemotaxis protein
MNEPMQERIDDPARPGFVDSPLAGSVSTRRDSASPGQAATASIIVWDASPLSLLTLAGVMDSQGYRCICARDSKSALKTLHMGRQDLLVCDVGDDAAGALETIEKLRSIEGYEQLPAVLIAESRWAGLEKKAEAAFQPTRCLFKPIDPNALIAVVDQLLWMPKLVDSHRRRGSRPTRPGWVSL